jgi:hypothetical protein
VEVDSYDKVVEPTECVLVIKAAQEEQVVKQHPLLSKSFSLFSG